MHVNHILNCGLFYESKNKLYVYGYIDGDWANKIWNKKNQLDLCFHIGVMLLMEEEQQQKKELFCQAQRLNSLCKQIIL
jgi:hypothetical protein